jgi:nitrogenase molybdenum-cofactor synthesis protein NifE
MQARAINDLLEDRRGQVLETSADTAPEAMRCGTRSAAGSVSQRACVFCGSRVVLYPIADALHLVHGPAGCAAYTWDIRGALSSGPVLHRNSFTTDLRETDVIYGGVAKLERALRELIAAHGPKAAFVYSTCIVGLIGDDVDAVCRRVQADCGIPVIPVDSEGFKGTKKDGYKAACAAIGKLIGTSRDPAEPPAPARSVSGINILGEFNLAGEAWLIRDCYKRMGVEVVATLTGDARVDTVRRAHTARFNVVQCSGSMLGLAAMMEEKYGQPYRRVSYFGLEDMAQALYDVADLFAEEDPGMPARAAALVAEEMARVLPLLEPFRRDLEGARAAIYVGGAFKAHSLIKALRHLGMRTVVVGSQTGNKEDYERLQQLCDPSTIILDDSNPVELSRFVLEKQADLLIGGVKERPIAYKLGLAFCDHNHERKIPLAGFEGMVNFAREVHGSVTSPVWKFARRRS